MDNLAEQPLNIVPEEQKLSFESEAPQENQVSFSSPLTTSPPSLELAQKRAEKASFATGKPIDGLLTSIQSGREEALRSQVAIEDDLKWKNTRYNLVNKLVQDSAAKGTPLSPQEYDVLNTLTREEWQTSPSTIFEKKMSEKFIRDKVVENRVEHPNGLWAKAFKENPESAMRAMNIWKAQGTKVNLIQTLTEDLEEESKQRGVIATVGGVVWGALTQWPSHAMFLQQAPWDALSLPGTIKREQISYLLSLPVQDFERETRKAISDLKRVSLDQAREFVQALKTFSTTDQGIMSAAGILDLTLLPLGRGAKAVRGLTERTRDRLIPNLTPSGRVDTFKIDPTDSTFMGPKQINVTSKFDFNTLPPIKELFQDTIRYRTQGELFSDLKIQSPGPAFSRAVKDQSEIGIAQSPQDIGKLRGTYKPIAQQEREAEAASKLTGRDLSTGHFTPGQGRYNQLDFQDLDKPRGFDKVLFKRRTDTYDKTKPFVDEVPGTEGGTYFGTSSRTGSTLTSETDQLIASTSYVKAMAKASDEPVIGGQSTGGGKAVSAGESGNSAGAAVIKDMYRRTPMWENAVMRPVDLDLLPSAYNHQAQAFYGNNASLANQKAIQKAVERDRQMEAVSDMSMRVRRIPNAVEAKAAEATATQLMREWAPKLNDAILDVVHLPSELFRHNVGMGILRVGDNRTKLPFTSREQAELFAKDIYKLDKDQYGIYVNGNEYYIGVRANVAENTDRTLNYLADIVKGYAPPSLVSVLNKFRMTDSYLDAGASAQRKVAAHAQQGMKAMVKEVSDVFASLGRKQAKEVEATINDFGNKRKWFDTAEDFKQAFMGRHKKAPTDAQIEAAYTYKQLQDHDYTIRNLGMYRDMARQGAEQWTIATKGEAAYFNGIQLDKLPWGRGEDFTIAVYRAGDAEATVGFAHQAERLQGKLSKAEIDKMINDGGRVIQVFDPSARPLQAMGITDKHVNYIVTDAASSKPLSWLQLKYEPGPHSIYPHEWYVKQAKISEGHLGKLFYYGDNTLWNFSTQAEAKQWLERLEEARKLVKAGSPGAEAYIVKNLPYASLKEFNKLRSQYDFDAPFSLTQRGRSVFETQLDLEKQFPGTLNFHKSSHNPQNFMDRTFLQERDELLNNPAIRAGQPVFEAGKQLDAYEALERGLNQSIRNMWLNDEKIRATTQWIEKYADLIEVNNPAQLRATPLYFLYNGNLKNVASNQQAVKVAAEQERQAIINFVGQQTEFGQAIGMFKTAMMDGIYKAGGKNSADIASEFSLGFIRDPAAYMRAAAAHLRIGMFNPIPMFQQAMTFMNVAAIAPQHTVRAASAAGLMRVGGHTTNEAVLNHIAKSAEKFGWKAKDFKEMHEAFRMTNLNYVGKEAVFRHDNFDPHLFKTATGAIMDKGFMFFNIGERLTRKASFASAYSEWRAANPKALLNEEAIAGIQQRADTMAGHMTSASLSNFQQGGLPSVMLQFTTYYNHMAQLMLGKELSVMEKTRLIALNSALFGMPAGLAIGGLPSAVTGAVSGYMADGLTGAAVHGASAAIGMWPIYDDIMEYAKANGDKILGMDVNHPAFQTLLKGIPNVAFQWATGKDPDIAKNYALGMNGYIRDILRQDKTFDAVLMGASGSVIGDILSSVYPLTVKTSQAIMGEGSFKDYNKADFEKVARNIATLDLGAKVWAAAAYGKFVSKKDVEVRGLDTMDAFLTALRLSPKQAQEAYLKMNVYQNQKDHQKKFEDLALEYIRRANNQAKEGNFEQYDTLMKDANKYIELGDFGYADRLRIRQRARQESKGFEENMERRYQRSAPKTQQENMTRFPPQHFRTNP